MRSLISIILLCVFFTSIYVGCEGRKVNKEKKNIALTENDKNIMMANNQFGFNLFKEIVKQEGENKNIFISPFSITFALGMTYNGAAGETKIAMHNTLQFGELQPNDINNSFKNCIELFEGMDELVKFSIANSIWYRKDLQVKEKFIADCKEYFKASIQGMEFNNEDADVINNWVKENTNNKIEKIVEKPIDPSLVMFLINAIYFKGDWKIKFDPANTFETTFKDQAGKENICKMMEQKLTVPYFEGDNFQAVDLPYGNNIYSMTIFLPKEGTDIDDFINTLSLEKFIEWYGSLHFKEITIKLPRFELEYEIELKDVLTALGMGIAFGPADFSNMVDGGGMQISKVKHKTYIKTDEEGSEAAAVTSVEMTKGLLPIMNINRPFVFVIREGKLGSILFIGKIVKP